MSDTGETFRAIREETKLGKDLFGIPCPTCLKAFPDTEPTIMTPQKIRRRHKRNYRDNRTWKQVAIERKLAEQTNTEKEYYN